MWGVRGGFSFFLLHLLFSLATDGSTRCFWILCFTIQICYAQIVGETIGGQPARDATRSLPDEELDEKPETTKSAGLAVYFNFCQRGEK